MIHLGLTLGYIVLIFGVPLTVGLIINAVLTKIFGKHIAYTILLILCGSGLLGIGLSGAGNLLTTTGSIMIGSGLTLFAIIIRLRFVAPEVFA